jgi:serine/threonine-protein kinase
VLDFGLVKRETRQQDKDSARLTSEGIVTGTPAFLPPEAVSGSDTIGPHSDLYSLGCVAYWLLTGRLLFEGDSPVKVAYAHATEDPMPPSAVSEEPIPAPIEELVMQLLAKRPTDRPASALELLEKLDACEGVEEWGPAAAEKWWRLHAPDVIRHSP